MLADVAGCFASMRRSQSDVGFWNDCARLFGLACIHDVFPVINGQNLLPIQPYLNQCLVFLRKPEPINFLVLPYKVSALDPERQLFRGMAFNPHHRVILYINPKLAFKQILVFPLRPDLGDEATIRTHLLFTQQIQGIVVSGNGAVMMFFCRLPFRSRFLSGDSAPCAGQR
jgi:hypothetical protein